jgi:integrase
LGGKVGFQDATIFDKAGLEKAGKSDVQVSASANPLCPNCGSEKSDRAGHRYLTDGYSVQRWLCKKCAYRFSEKPPQEKLKWQINTQSSLISKRRICAEDAKNLIATETKTVAGDTPIKRMKNPGTQSNLLLISAEARGLITEYMAYLEREGFSHATQYPTNLSHLVKDGADLLDPENVKEVIAKQKKKTGEPWSDSMKMLATCAYDAFCQMRGITWRRPTYTQNEATVYVPDEKELDLLISAAPRKKMSTFLGCLKETFADPSEIIAAEWIDFKGNVFSINHPVKGHLPGKYELTSQLCLMINALPRKNKRIFASKYDTLYTSFVNIRKRAADKFQNPALLSITFKSFRHWGGTMIAQLSNGNALTIMKMLRHKSFESSRKYIHAIQFQDQDYDVTQATTPEEILALGKAGWMKYDEITIAGAQLHFFRKPERLGGVQIQVDKSQ